MAFSSTGLLVKGPRPAQERRYGLFSVVQPVTPADVHWQAGGVQWEDFLCTTVESFTTDCPPVTGHTKSKERDINFCSSDPFAIKGSYDCSTGGRTAGDAFEIARQRLLQWEEHELERVLWTGEVANGLVNPSLEEGNDTCDIATVDLTPGGGATSVVGGLAALEDALADLVPNGGVIHAPYGLAAYLARFNLLERVGDRYYTPAGQSVVLGAGYPGTGPGGVAAAAGTTWIAASGPVAVWRSNVFMVPDAVEQAVDRQINDVTVYAERIYATGFSCGVFMVNVTLSCEC